MSPAEEDLERELAADYQCYHVGGTHERIGYETAKRGGSVIEPGTQLAPDAREVAKASRAATREVFPEILAEFRGYGRALELADDELLWHYAPGVDGACSIVALETEAGTLVGRNYDYFYAESRRHLVYTTPDRGYAHVGTHEGLVGGRFEGLNERGLFVGFTGAGEPDTSVAGIPFHLVVRYLLETCSSATDACETLRELPLREPKGYLLADAEAALVVEAHPERTAVREPTDGVIAMTNHFHHSEMVTYQPPWENSVRRYDRLRSLAARESPTRDDVIAVLRDHDAPVCGHEDGLATFWSCLVEPASTRVSYSLGAPCRNEYAWTSVVSSTAGSEIARPNDR